MMSSQWLSLKCVSSVIFHVSYFCKPDMKLLLVFSHCSSLCGHEFLDAKKIYSEYYYLFLYILWLMVSCFYICRSKTPCQVLMLEMCVVKPHQNMCTERGFTEDRYLFGVYLQSNRLCFPVIA